MMANFYPGPSRVYSTVPEIVKQAYERGILSLNHRSAEFMEIMDATKFVLHDRLMIPAEYEIVFTSSATECWEIIAQSLTARGSQHFYNGSFGEKWASYASEIRATKVTNFGINETLPTGDIDDSCDVICVTQNETSNATQVDMETLGVLRRENQEKIIAVDVTSSLGGIQLDYDLADVWYASVQKCLGLPAGLGVMILSPFAVEKARAIGENARYNSLLRILENAEMNQTSYTPNVLGIYLLYQTQLEAKYIVDIEEELRLRNERYSQVFENHGEVTYLISNPKVRSKTVLAFETSRLDEIKAEAKEAGIILGSGYGPWKKSGFRIANFPAITDEEVGQLIQFFSK